MGTISNTPRPGYVWDSTDNVWYPIGVGSHNHSEIAKTIVDAKGDLIVGTANDTVARQAVGTDGQMLVADSTQTNGIGWANQVSAAGKNAVINGGMDIWQRGTSITATTSASNYGADRWVILRPANAGSITLTRQATSDTTNLPNIQYCARVQRTASSATTDVPFLASSFESVNSIPYSGKVVSFSFYARAGANYSSASNVLNFQLISGTGTDQNVYTGFTGAAAVINSTATLTTTWQRFTYTGTVSSSATQLGTYFYYTPTGTAGAADYFEITGVQLEQGSIATPFSRAGGTIQGELAACQRYYFRFGGSALYQEYGLGSAYSTTKSYQRIIPPVTMRVNPTSVDYSTLSLSDGANASVTVTSLILSGATLNMGTLEVTVASGLTQYRFYAINSANSLSGYLGLSAEL